MPIISDCHLHTAHSGDSEAPMEEMILKGIELGLKTMCFTEHNDFDYPDFPDEPGSIFTLNTDSYLYELITLKEKYADKIRILFGVELGMQPQLMRQNSVYAKSYDFDFIIASSHLCNGKDPYRKEFYQGRSDEEAYREYFESELENIKKFSNFDVYGHLDYAVRYGQTMDSEYSYEKYKDIFDKILTQLIDKGKGIELNTGGIKHGMRDFHPCMDVLKRYRELGGEIITVGSDAHKPDDIAAHFDRACDVLKECGFEYYTIFEKRNAEYIKL
jgi:histidinol-phosphatase (PHP family)